MTDHSDVHLRSDNPPDGIIARMWDEPDQRSVLIGIAGAILINLLVVVLGPLLFRNDRTTVPIANAKPHYNMTIDPEILKRFLPQPKPAQKFVEANPNAPENVPDKTNNFSDRNQQVAQEKPTPNGKSDMPATEGRKDLQSSAVVTGHISKPQEAVPVTPQSQQLKPTPPRPKAEQVPLSGFENKVGDDPRGFGSHIASPSVNPKDVNQQVKGMDNLIPDPNPNVQESQVDPTHPRPRPSLDRSNVRSAVLSERTIGTSNMGITAVDARFNNYGVYLKRLLEEIEAEWYRILESMQSASFQGTHVYVRFRLNSKGEIEQLVDVQSTAVDQATHACTSAITNPAPYGAWTPDMIETLGTEQDLMIDFFYE